MESLRVFSGLIVARTAHIGGPSTISLGEMPSNARKLLKIRDLAERRHSQWVARVGVRR